MPDPTGLGADDLKDPTVFALDEPRFHCASFWCAEKRLAASPRATVVTREINHRLEIVVLCPYFLRRGNRCQHSAGAELNDTRVVHHVVASFRRDQSRCAP